MTPRARRLGAVTGAVAALVIALAGCTAPSEPSPQPLTEEQAERLAVTRFRNFDAGVRAIDVSIPGTEIGELRLVGWFDYAAGVGYGAASTESGSLGLVWWNTSTIATRDISVDTATFPLPPDGWGSGALDASASELTSVLVLVGSLASDRPENPQLLRQSDAAWLRADEIDDVEVDVFAGPSGDDDPGTAEPGDSGELRERTRYWVDADGLMHRFEVRLGGGSDWTLVDFGDGGTVTLPTTVPGG